MTTLIHMGMSKSASTFLQTSFFDNNPNFYFSGLYNDKSKFQYYTIKELHDLTLLLVNQDQFVGLPIKMKDKINNELNKAKKLNKIFVYSNEHFCETVNPYFQANLLKDLFVNPKILLIIRSQYDILKSHYLYQGNKLLFVPNKYRGKHVDFKSYFEYLLFTKGKRGGHKARDWIYDFLRIIDYNHFIEINEKIFGSENIIIVPFEELTTDPICIYKYLKNKIDFSFDLSHEINKKKIRSSISPRGLFFIRLIKFFVGNYDNKKKVKTRMVIGKIKSFFPNFTNQLTRGGSDLTIPDDIRKEINDLYKNGNKKISDKYKINLKELGYPF